MSSPDNAATNEVARRAVERIICNDPVENFCGPILMTMVWRTSCQKGAPGALVCVAIGITIEVRVVP
jgi:hypothetical protein